MKKFLQYVFVLAAIGLSGWAFYYYTLDPCEKPLQYGIGRFDSQFGVSKNEFKNYITQAEAVWEKSIDRDIFLYDPDAEFKINLIYDERQLATVQKQKTEFGLSAVEDVFKKLDTEFNLFKEQYTQRVSGYESALAAFKKRQLDYENQVSFWNQRGGAPKEKYKSLEVERKYLNTETERLNNEALAINEMSKQLNVLLKERNLKASEYNKVAESYNQKYGDGLEFDQAEYVGNPMLGRGEINIYQFGNKKDLVMVVAHEFGHALGMDHVENPQSIMYYLTEGNTAGSLALSVEDLAELKRVCK